MNYSMISYILGWILNFEAGFLLLPALVAVIYKESSGGYFLVTSLISALVGFMIVRKSPKNKMFYTREGFITVALSWIVLSVVGAVPFVISGTIPNFIDALFETVSGFTTTGASILSDVESLPRCMLFWRSFTHWIGGMGVLVFILSVLPLVGGHYMNLMKAESPGPSVGKLLPKVKETAKILYGIYILLTIIQIILLLIAKMPMFDAITISFGTAGTGGFGIRNDSLGSYTGTQQLIVTVFMVLFGINFSAYFLILFGKWRQGIKFEEVRWYLLIILVSVLLIGFDIRSLYGSLSEALHHSAFQVASIITTTGYSTFDFNTWSSFSRSILILLMFIGACAGSTGGGIKVSRFVILFKTIKKEIMQFVHPRSVKKIKMDGHVIEHEVLRSVNVYMITYMLIFAISCLLISLDDFDLITNFSAVAATLNNIGPGLELVGPTQCFALFSQGSKLVLIFDMLAGRLELFPLLLLFVPKAWKRF